MSAKRELPAELVLKIDVDWQKAPATARVFTINRDGFGYFYDSMPSLVDGKWFGVLSAAPVHSQSIYVLYEIRKQLGMTVGHDDEDEDMGIVSVDAKIAVHHEHAPTGAKFFRVDGDGYGMFYEDEPYFDESLGSWVGIAQFEFWKQAIVDINSQIIEAFSELVVIRDGGTLALTYCQSSKVEEK